MTYPNPRGGGAGSGRRTFTPSASPFADAAARDTYFASNLEELFNSNTQVTVIEVGSATEMWGGDNEPSTYDNTRWLTSVQGAFQSDYTETDTNSPEFIQNKPTSLSAINSGEGMIISAIQGLTNGNFAAFTNGMPTAFTQAQLQGDWNETNTASVKYIANKPGHFRGNFSTTATYATGDIVRSNYQGRAANFIAAAALLPSTELPEARLDSGFWFLATDRTWRGNWVASDYIAGQVAMHSGELWMANTIIGVGDTNPPSETNMSWDQISGSSGGGGGSNPTVQFVRQNTTLPGTINDNTFVVVQPTAPDAGTLITITLPDVGASPVIKRLTVVNDRPNVNGNVQVNLASGDSISNLFGDIDIMPGDAWQFVVTEENRWVVGARGEIPLFPSFPSNPQNDDNTFMFGVNGDTPATWTRDRNTTIDLNRASGTIENYEIANPATSGITVNDGEGYIFRNINANNWRVFPFSGANTMIVDGTTVTSSAPLILQANTSLVLLYDSGQSRWEGTVFNRLLPAASAGAGGASEANASSLPDSGKWFARNEDVATLNDAEGVSVRAIDGFQAMVKAGLGSEKFLNGFNVGGDTPVNDSSQVVYFGTVRSMSVFDGLALAASPFAQNTQLYWDSSLSRVRDDDESGAHIECGRVLSSNWILPTGTTFLSDQTIDTQGEWDAWVGLIHDKGYAGGGEVQIPDLQEGSSEATADPGAQFIARVGSGNGTLNIRPRGASTIEPKPGSGATGTYTNASPLPMTSATNSEFVLIEVNEDGDGYYHYPINQFALVTEFHFSALDYFRRVYEQQSYDMSVLIQANTAARADLQNPNITLVNSDSFSFAASIGVGYRHMQRISSGATATWTFTDTVGAIPVGRTQQILIDNSRQTSPILVVAPRNYRAMACDRMVVLPGEQRLFVLHNDSGTLQIGIEGPVVYEFTLEAPTVVGTPSLINLDDVPTAYSQLFSTSTTPGELDRFIFAADVAGDLEVQYECTPGYGGSSTAYPNHTNLSFRLDENGNTGTPAVTATLLQAGITATTGSFSRKFTQTGLTGGQYVNPVVANMTADTSLSAIQFHFKITLKKA